MIEIISKSRRVVQKWPIRSFCLGSNSRCGYSFDCDIHGNVLMDSSNESYLLSYLKVIYSPDYIDEGVIVLESSYRQPSIGRCSCGREVELWGFTNTCDCGLDYNSSGQLLAPRCFWGEETGESLSDILRIP